MAGIQLTKSALRKEMQQVIKKITPEEKQRQSLKVFEKLCALPQYQKSKRISLYLSTKDEIDTVAILKHIFENNKEAFVPRYNKSNMEMVKLHSIKDYEALPLTKWNIKQPDLNDIRENVFQAGDIDLIIIPGVAFTNQGHRLGHGKGYYDKFLKTCFLRLQKRPHLIALAFNEQVRESIPVTEDDVSIDIILTETSEVPEA